MSPHFGLTGIEKPWLHVPFPHPRSKNRLTVTSGQLINPSLDDKDRLGTLETLHILWESWNHLLLPTAAVGCSDYQSLEDGWTRNVVKSANSAVVPSASGATVLIGLDRKLIL